MEKILDQEQIDKMVREARGGGGPAGAAGPAVTLWDARKAGQIGRAQLQSISALHEAFARNLTNSVGAYLRIGFTAALVSAEHLSYGEFLQRLPEVTYLASCKLSPAGASALMQMDLAAAFPLIDVLLGGEGKGAPPGRQITGIEEQILETVMRIICRDLESAWHVLALTFEFDRRQDTDQVQHLMPQQEKTLSLSFELTVAESRGTLNLVFPAVVSNALLRKIAAAWVRSKPAAAQSFGPRLRSRLLECPFEASLGVDIPGVPVRRLAELQPGSLLLLAQPVQKPAQLRVSGHEMFAAAVARCREKRAAQVLQARAELPDEEGRRP